MKMLVSDFIVEFLISKGVTDVFGYQGGMITYLFDAFKRHEDKIKYHIPYNEQGASFAACGYAQSSGKLGFAFVTSGPGFTNLATGIANAYFDSIPTMFISAQVNFKDKRHGAPYRQKGFQEINAPEIAKPMVKKSYDIETGDQIYSSLLEAYNIAMGGRKGPVFLEIPINVFRDQIDVPGFDVSKEIISDDSLFSKALHELSEAKRPLIIAGAGIDQSGTRDLFRRFVNLYQVPVVTTLPGIDILPDDSDFKFQYIGASGRRLPNLLLTQADYVLTIGTRLSTRQVGHHLECFAPLAKLTRIDIDENEFARKIKEDEFQIHSDIKPFLEYALNNSFQYTKEDRSSWGKTCRELRTILEPFDKSEGNKFMEKITSLLPENSNIVLDVGKNEIWGAQSSKIKKDTRAYLSTGLGSMGYSLPAAIGAYYGNGNPTFSFNGDGGIQMNIQELQTISENRLPIKIFVLNNRALGMITLFQDQYFDSRYVADKDSVGDYHSAKISKIAEAYGIKGISLRSIDDIENYRDELQNSDPVLFEYNINNDDEPILPGIPAGSDPLTNGPSLPESDVTRIKKHLI
jgi:acetolactate synthase-1/2/3 large subunit